LQGIRIGDHTCSECSNSLRLRSTALYNHFLLTQAQRDRIEIILVSPRNPLNIGAIARTMANFGFSRLTVTAPYAPHWREARSAIGAPELLRNAHETESLAEAAADCTFVAGTGTLTHRKPEQRVLSLPELAPVFAHQLDRGGRVALIFGPEKHGLTRDDLSYCNALVQIPTDPRQPSMNLGQAAAVCLYELSREVGPAAGLRGLPPFPQETVERMGHGNLKADPATSSGELSATSSSLDRLAALIEETMIAAGYSPRAMQPANRHDLRLLLRRLALSSLDTRRMLGLFRRILYRLHRPSSDPKSSQ
jgi:TrmH family RNA methyltransferase